MKELLKELLRRIFDFHVTPARDDDPGVIMNYMVPDKETGDSVNKKGAGSK